jgi:hypothetical protein
MNTTIDRAISMYDSKIDILAYLYVRLIDSTVEISAFSPSFHVNWVVFPSLNQLGNEPVIMRKTYPTTQSELDQSS